ncbi:MAG: hypothetical protein JXL81_06315 [Deltaproteobacteria bacterium]|nr:hypothetical protein [Deltaproteobacteria bacterium]
MPGIVNIDKARLEIRVKKGFKKWNSRFGCFFDISTRMEQIPDKALAFLAEGTQKSAVYYYDIIMSIKGLGPGSGFDELSPAYKMAVIDIHLFLLDRVRYEYMKRLGWIDCYAGEEYSIFEQIRAFNDLAPDIQARPPVLSRSHPQYMEYMSKNLFEKDEIIRKLIPEALKKLSF